MKKTLFWFALAAAFVPSAAWSQIVVRIGPPRVVVERPIPPPGPHYIWQPGFYRWEGARYIWVPGRYALPPRPGVVWIAPHWVSNRGNWVFIDGVWR